MLLSLELLRAEQNHVPDCKMNWTATETDIHNKADPVSVSDDGGASHEKNRAIAHDPIIETIEKEKIEVAHHLRVLLQKIKTELIKKP